MVKELPRLTGNPEAAGGTPWPIQGAGSAPGLQNSPFYFLMGWKCLMVDYEVKCCLLLINCPLKDFSSLMKQRDPCGWTSVKRAKELIEQGLISQEMRYFVKETIIYVLVVVFEGAKLLNHAKNPCSHLKDFVPDTEGMARCFRMWDLDARGFHKSTWRFWIKKNHILAVGCPASEYCKNKPQELEPIYLPNKETRPKDPI